MVPEAQPEAANYGCARDAAGNVIRFADAPAGGQAAVRCYSNDRLRRLTAAWTPTSATVPPLIGPVGR